MKLLYWWVLLTIPFALLWAGCGSTGESVGSESRSQPVRTTSNYTSVYPDREISGNIKSLFRSVKRISATSNYRSYYFGDQLVTLEELRNSNLRERASRIVTRSESVAGTAISIAQHSLSTALLTCAHVVSFPDTLVEYVSGEDLPEKTYVSSIAVKRSQRNLLFDLPHVEQFEIVDTDPVADLALLRYSRKQNRDLEAPPLPIKMGDSRKLGWGSIIYIAGYPKGFPMIVRGMVSDPNRNAAGDFLTDALFNPGISGGIIVASRNGFRSFEWVGIANTASANHELMLVPDPSIPPTSYNMLDSYPGIPFIDRKTIISYGITQSIPTSRIVNFLNRNRRMLSSMGLDI